MPGKYSVRSDTHCPVIGAAVVALFTTCAAFADAQGAVKPSAPTSPNDFPTLARVEYVQECINRTGGNQGNVTYNYTNANDGSVVMQNFGTVTYTGLEPISNSGTVTNVVFNLPMAANVATLSDLGAGSSRLASTGTFEQTDFANPSGSLTINGSVLNDSISVGALATNYPSLTINGNEGNDTVNFTGNVTFGAAASLDVNLQNDDPTPGIDNVSVAGELIV